MDKEHEKILLSLNNLITFIDEISYIAPLLSPLKTVIIENIDNFKTSYLNKEGDDSKNNILDVENHLINLINNTTLSLHNYLQEKIFESVLEWMPSPIVNLAEEAEFFALILEKYKAFVSEKNQAYLLEFTKYKETLPKNRHTKPIIPSINKLLKQLTDNPDTLPAIDTIKNLQNEIRTLKKPRARVVEIKNRTHHDESLLSHQIHQLNAQFKVLSQESALFAIRDDILQHEVSAEFLLKQYIDNFRACDKEAQLLIIRINHRFMHQILQKDYHPILRNELLTAISQLSFLNQQRQQQSLEILKRFTILLPRTTNWEELEIHRSLALEELSKNIEDFLLNFLVLDLGNKTDPDTIYFTRQLVDFIEKLAKDLLKKEVPSDKTRIADFRKALLEHLGEKTTWLSLSATQKSLQHTMVNQFIISLIPNNQAPIQDEKILKQQIAFIYHLSAKVNAFPLKMIKDYHIYKNIEATQQKMIQDQFSDLNKDAGQTINKLNQILDYFSADSEDTDQAKKYKQQLEVIQANLLEEMTYYDTKRTQLLNIPSPLLRLEEITRLQDEKQLFLTNLRETLNGLQVKIEQITQDLSRIYNSQRRILLHRLHQLIQDTTTALSILETKTTIEKMLSQQQKTYDTQLANKDKLYWIELEVKHAIQDLNHIVDLEKNKLKYYIQPNIEETNKKLQGQMIPPLSELNPYFTSLPSQKAQAETSVKQVNTIFSRLAFISGAQLKSWFEQLNTEWEIARNDISLCEELRNKAQELERRLQSREYCACIAVLETLRTEYQRIINSYIDDALELDMEPEQKEALLLLKRTSLDSLDAPELINVDQQLLDKIDLRLFKLLSMHLQFKAINSQYINQNINLLNDGQYIELLLNNVEVHLRNDHMEKISDGLRPQFVQWLRINVFKPIQTLKHNVSNYFNSENQKGHHFFFTVFACKTEKALISIGNDVYDRLVAPAA